MRFISNKVIQLLLLPAAFLPAVTISTLALAESKPVSSVTTPKAVNDNQISLEAAKVLDKLHQAASSCKRC